MTVALTHGQRGRAGWARVPRAHAAAILIERGTLLARRMNDRNPETGVADARNAHAKRATSLGLGHWLLAQARLRVGAPMVVVGQEPPFFEISSAVKLAPG
jgi:hypothetical protein